MEDTSRFFFRKTMNHRIFYKRLQGQGRNDHVCRIRLQAQTVFDPASKTHFLKMLNGELPYTIGGGIGQSRLCMLLLGSAHIGEVQASVWDNTTREACEKAGIPLL